jgi:hypothetical protein
MNREIAATVDASRPARISDRIPPHVFFVGSAVFHYLGPAFAVLLFAHVSVRGVAWLRIASAAIVFALWRRPWRTVLSQSVAQRKNLLGLGVVLGSIRAIARRICQLIWMILNKGVRYEEGRPRAFGKLQTSPHFPNDEAWLPSRTSRGSGMSSAICDHDTQGFLRQAHCQDASRSTAQQPSKRL